MRGASAHLALAVGAILLSVSAIAADSVRVTRTSRPVRLLRTWQETIKSASGLDFVRRVELVFDYEKGFAQENYYTPEGRPAGTRRVKLNPPQPSAEEIAEAKELILRDRGLARIISRRAAEFDGGFLLEEPPGRPCGPGSRCIQLQILTPDHSGLLRWTVVDLVPRRIAYPIYVPQGARR